MVETKEEHTLSRSTPLSSVLSVPTTTLPDNGVSWFFGVVVINVLSTFKKLKVASGETVHVTDNCEHGVCGSDCGIDTASIVLPVFGGVKEFIVTGYVELTHLLVSVKSMAYLTYLTDKLMGVLQVSW